MNGQLDRFEKVLSGLERKSRRRDLIARAGLDFASNDYLALAGSPALRGAVLDAVERGVPVGAGGSRLLRGNDPEHEQLEVEAARFFGAERALFFGGGYFANFALLTTLPQKGDLIVCDELIHASCHEGVHAARARSVLARHNDAAAFEDAIRQWRDGGGAGRIWIVVESLYSMDGDFAPLPELMEIADRNDAFVIVDEAHATGVYGADGRGLSADFEGRENVISLHTCGKALGASGALVCAAATICDFMVNRARPFIYATAPSPVVAAAVREALNIVRTEPERRARLAALVAYANAEAEARCGVRPSRSQILPVIVGDNSRAMRLASAMQARGFDIRGVRPPTVPEGTARLRIALTLNVGRQTVIDMLDALAEELEALPE